MHRDASTSPESGTWWFLGGGPLACVLKTSQQTGCSPYGLLLWSPDQFARVESTWLFHPEGGLGGTMIAVDHGGNRHRPSHASTDVRWIDPLSPDSDLLLTWRAEGLSVTERFTAFHRDRHSPWGGLRREIEVRRADDGVPGPEQTTATIICGLLPNPLVFEGLPRTTSAETLGVFPQGSVAGAEPADASPTMEFVIVEPAPPAFTLFERFVQVEGRIEEKGGLRLVVEYRVSEGEEDVARRRTALSVPGVEIGEGPAGRIAIQYARSLQGIRCVVDRKGRFDASVWQYGYEWGQDAAVVATALAYAGEHALAWRIMENVLDRLVDAEGRVAESSRFRGGDLAELNANGAVLSAAATCARLSGESGRLEERMDTLLRVGDLALEATDRSVSGLIEGRRDLWERLPWMGVEEGADIATNSFVVRGLLDIAPLLRAAGEENRADAWEEGAHRMLEVMFSGRENSFVDGDHLIHRRLTDGRPSETMTASVDYHDRRYRPYMPIGTPPGPPRRSGPDSVEALPILLGLLPPDSRLSSTTLDRLDAELWNATGIGGYLRSPLESDPDSPGPWPFVTAWMAEAELRAGKVERGGRTTGWLLDRAGNAGSWHEYYGPPRTPPYPPVGIIVWGWAQYLLLCIRGWYGIDLAGESLRIAPRLDGFCFRTSISGHDLELDVRDHTAPPAVSGSGWDHSDGALSLPLPLTGPTQITFG